MKRCLVLLVLIAVHTAAVAGPLAPSVPESQGVSSRGVLQLIEAFEKEVDAIHGFVLLRHGHTVAEGWWSPFDRRLPHKLYSLSKSFTSTAIGMAVEEGWLTVDDAVLSFFPEDAPTEPADNLRAMRVRDLLTMTTGHAKDTLGALTGGTDENWPRAFLALPVEHKPGTHFVYNSGATYMLSAILQKVTGQTLLDYLTPRLFRPLGIENASWEADPRGIHVGGWGLNITTRDIAKFGQLYLQEGVWEGQRLLSSEWVAAATAAQVPNGANPESDWNQGYGYQFWRSRHNAYRGDGAFGQFCLVLPQQQTVLAITAGQRDMQQILNLVWKHLLPALHTGPLPPDESSYLALKAKLAGLRHPIVEGTAVSPLASTLSGRRFKMEPNNAGVGSVTFQRQKHDTIVTFLPAAQDAPEAPKELRLTPSQWRRQIVPFRRLGMPLVATSGAQPVAASGAWVADDRYVVRAWIYETPYRLDMEFHFDSATGALTMKQKVHPVQSEWTVLRSTQ